MLYVIHRRSAHSGSLSKNLNTNSKVPTIARQTFINMMVLPSGVLRQGLRKYLTMNTHVTTVKIPIEASAMYAPVDTINRPLLSLRSLLNDFWLVLLRHGGI